MGRATAGIDKLRQDTFKLSHSVVKIVCAAVVRDAGGSDASLDTLPTRALAIALVLATVALHATVPDTLSPLALA